MKDFPFESAASPSRKPAREMMARRLSRRGAARNQWLRPIPLGRLGADGAFRGRFKPPARDCDRRALAALASPVKAR